MPPDSIPLSSLSRQSLLRISGKKPRASSASSGTDFSILAGAFQLSKFSARNILHLLIDIGIELVELLRPHILVCANKTLGQRKESNRWTLPVLLRALLCHLSWCGRMGCLFLSRADTFVRRLGRFVWVVRRVHYRTALQGLVGQGRGSGP
jgi:hypothetical protein